MTMAIKVDFGKCVCHTCEWFTKKECPRVTEDGSLMCLKYSDPEQVKNRLKDAIDLLSQINNACFDDPKGIVGELRCGSLIHSRINSFVVENTEQDGN